MSYLTILREPEVDLDCLIIAFGGWADAGESATSAIKFIQRQLGAKKFAEIDPEEFYDFTQTRPYTTRTRDGGRRVQWPENEFSYWVGPGSSTDSPTNPSKGAMTFIGVEPNLKWRTYSKAIIELAHKHGVKKFIHVGALLDAVPHTRDVKLTGTSTDPEQQQTLEEAGIHSSNYQGPTGISSAMMEACANQGIEYLSLWGAHVSLFTGRSQLPHRLHPHQISFQHAGPGIGPVRAKNRRRYLRRGSGAGHRQGRPAEQLRPEVGKPVR